METLLEYIGPISLVAIILIYSIYSFFNKPKTRKVSPTQKTNCPKCKSTKLLPYQPEKIQYSRKAAAIGHILDGNKGALFGMLYEADRTYYKCRYCGYHFSKKENRILHTD